MKRLINRLRPMGAVRPTSLRRNAVRAYLYGVADGWNQPRYLSISRNVDHLFSEDVDPWDTQDRGINLGQWLRSPLNHQHD